MKVTSVILLALLAGSATAMPEVCASPRAEPFNHGMVMDGIAALEGAVRSNGERTQSFVPTALLFDALPRVVMGCSGSGAAVSTRRGSEVRNSGEPLETTNISREQDAS